jgi:hypothetical protein
LDAYVEIAHFKALLKKVFFRTRFVFFLKKKANAEVVALADARWSIGRRRFWFEILGPFKNEPTKRGYDGLVVEELPVVRVVRRLE